jgi:hypothetical protein
MLRPLTTGELLDRTFQIYRKNFLVFAGIAAIPQIAILLIKLGLLGINEKSSGGALTSGLAAFFLLLLAIVGGAVTTAATTFGVSDVYLGKQTSISSCFRRIGWGTALAVIGTSILYGLYVTIGFLLLIIPGIYLAGRYGLATPAVVLEDQGPSGAMSRSKDLTERSVLRVLVIYMLTYALIIVLSGLMGVGIGALALGITKQVGSTTSKALTEVAAAIANSVITPVLAVALTVLYYDQRVRKEAFDIENMMSLLGEPTVPGNAEGATAGS